MSRDCEAREKRFAQMRLWQEAKRNPKAKVRKNREVKTDIKTIRFSDSFVIPPFDEKFMNRRDRAMLKLENQRFADRLRMADYGTKKKHSIWIETHDPKSSSESTLTRWDRVAYYNGQTFQAKNGRIPAIDVDSRKGSKVFDEHIGRLWRRSLDGLSPSRIGFSNYHNEYR